jgi:hypothetical protein
LRLDGFSEVMENEYRGVKLETDFSLTGVAPNNVEKRLEHILESGRSSETEKMNIVHSLVFKQNRDIYKNHYLFAKMIE